MVNVGVTPCHKNIRLGGRINIIPFPKVGDGLWHWGCHNMSCISVIIYVYYLICISSYIMYIYISSYMCIFLYVWHMYIYNMWHMYQYIISGTTMYISVLLFPYCIYIYIVHVCVGLYVCLVLPVRIRTNNFSLKKQDAYPIIPPCTVIKRGNGKAPIHRWLTQS